VRMGWSEWGRSVAVRLIRRGADPSVKFDDRLGLVEMSAANNHRQMLSFLVASVSVAAVDSETTANDLRSDFFAENVDASYLSARFGFLDVFLDLIGFGVAANKISSLTWDSAIRNAAMSGNAQILEFLHLFGSKKESKSGKNSELDTTERFAELLYVSAKHGHVGVMKLLWEFILPDIRPASLNTFGSWGCGLTCLMAAALGGHLSTIQWLCSIPCVEINLQNRMGMTALMCGVEGGSEEVVECLLAAGANPNSKTHVGETPLSLSVKRGNSFVQSLLVKAVGRN